MALTYSEFMKLGTVAPGFSLKSVSGKTVSLSDFNSYKAVVVVFMCNHCPYVKAMIPRINDLAKKYESHGVKVIGINSNDSDEYSEDSFEMMQKLVKENRYAFEYLIDETQNIARAYMAVCTPDFYVFENDSNDFKLKYHGRFDDNWKDAQAVKEKELENAVISLLQGKSPTDDQKPSMGCNIKWKK